MWNIILDEQEKVVLRQDLVNGKYGFKICKLLAFKLARSFQFSSGIPQRNIKYVRELSIDPIRVC